MFADLWHPGVLQRGAVCTLSAATLPAHATPTVQLSCWLGYPVLYIPRVPWGWGRIVGKGPVTRMLAFFFFILDLTRPILPPFAYFEAHL